MGENMSSFLRSSIAVTGCGCLSAAGIDCSESNESIRNGMVKSRLPSGSFFPASFSAPCFLAVDSLPVEYEVLKSEAKGGFSHFNRTIQLALASIDEGLAEAGITLDELRSKRVGIALGTTVGCTFHNEAYYIDWKKGVAPDPALLLQYFSSHLAEAIQTILGVQGPRIVITNACASGTDAIGMAKGWLAHDLCDIVVAGGVDELSRIACHGFNSLMLVSEKNCAPFDVNRQGLSLGEAAGILILEREHSAVADKRTIRGWVRGYGIAGDGHHPTAPHPEGRGLQHAVCIALKDAGLGKGDISMINAHGTGTRANDLAETKAIAEVGFDGNKVSVVSTKGITGHTLGAAGGVEAVFTLMALNQGEVFGTVGCIEPDPELSFPVLPQGQRVELSGRIGLSQSLAFGGSNSALVLEGSGL